MIKETGKLTTSEQVPGRVSRYMASLRRAGAMLIRGTEMVRIEEAYARVKTNFNSAVSSLNLDPTKNFEAAYVPRDVKQRGVIASYKPHDRILDVVVLTNTNHWMNRGSQWSHDSFTLTFDPEKPSAVIDSEGRQYLYKRSTLTGEEYAIPYNGHAALAIDAYYNATRAITELVEGRLTGETVELFQTKI